MNPTGPVRIVEWSPNGVSGFDPGTKKLTPAANFGELSSLFGGGSIVVAVSRRSSFVKALRVPNAGVREIDLILQTQMASMFPVPLSELSYSFRLTEDVSDEGRLAVVAAMQEEDLQSLVTQAKEAGFKIDRILPAGFGSMALGEVLGHKDAAVAQKTVEGLSIDLLAGGELRSSRVAPLPKNPELIESEITRSLSALGLPCVPTIAVTGLEFADAEIRSATTSLEALSNASLDKIGINLETRDVREKRAKSAQTVRVRLASLMWAAAAIFGLLAYDQYDKAEYSRSKTERFWTSELSKARKDRDKLETQVGKLEASSGSVTRAFTPAQPLSDVLTTVVNHVPKGVWLTGLTLERGKGMYIRGTATDSNGVSDYLQLLSTEPRLRDVKLSFANNGDIEKTPIVQFSIQAFPVGNLPLVEAKKKGAKK